MTEFEAIRQEIRAQARAVQVQTPHNRRQLLIGAREAKVYFDGMFRGSPTYKDVKLARETIIEGIPAKILPMRGLIVI